MSSSQFNSNSASSPMVTPKRQINVAVVLIESLYGSNIGASSRAMSNMGVDRLILINPQCEVDYATHQAASNGQYPLENRRVYSDLEKFYQNEPEGIRFAFTARDGRGRIVESFKNVLVDLNQNHPSFQKQGNEPIHIYLIFGREDCGLSADDLKMANFCCSIPTYGKNTSLNLAQAVLLALFILQDTMGSQVSTLEGAQAPKSEMDIAYTEVLLKKWIETLGFDLSKKKINAFTVFKRMLLRNAPTKKEIRIFEIVIQQTIRKLKTNNPKNSDSIDLTNEVE